MKINVPCGGAGLSRDRLFSGAFLFHLKTTHGFPLDFALDRIVNVEGIAVDWPEFVEEARRNKWWDFQTFEAIEHAMVDAELPRDYREAVRLRLMKYILDTLPTPR